MPDRIIRESALLSVTLDALSDGAERLFWRLVLVADDHGRFDADGQVVLARAFPRRVGTLRTECVRAWFDEMWAAGLIEVYRVGERTYARFLTWQIHQRRRDSRPKFPAPTDGTLLDPPQSAATCGNPPQSAAIRRSRAHVRGPRAVNYREPRAESRAERHQAATGGELPQDVPPRGNGGDGDRGPSQNGLNGHGPAEHPPVVFRIPASVVTALDRAPKLGGVRALRDPSWWQAEVRANVGVDLAREVLDAEAWMKSNPARAPKSDFPRFLHGWLKRADRAEAEV